jgi:hypothetical protein
MSDAKHDWTHDMLRSFRELYGETPELSFRRIAALMSIWFDITLTANACIGKAHRLGLPMRGHRTGPRKPHVAHIKRPKMVKVRIDAPIPPEPEPRAATGLTIYQTREGDCKWPLGETYARPPFLYCGEASLLGRSYCVTHMAKATGGRT